MSERMTNDDLRVQISLLEKIGTLNKEMEVLVDTTEDEVTLREKLEKLLSDEVWTELRELYTAAIQIHSLNLWQIEEELNWRGRLQEIVYPEPEENTFHNQLATLLWWPSDALREKLEKLQEEFDWRSTLQEIIYPEVGK